MLRSLLVVLAIAIAGCSDRSPAHEPPPVSSLIDLNRASVAQLEALPGIGPKLARKIIASRNARGGKFASPYDLLEIDGIGDQTLRKIAPYIVVFP